MSVDCEPSSSETVTTVMVPASVDKGSVHTFFKFQPSSGHNSEKKAKGNLTVGNKGVPGHSEHSTESSLMQPLPLPPTAGLTRSQVLFSIGTAMDVRSLAVQGDIEFYLFMEMRAEFQWTSFAMTSQKWVSATHIYNERLEQQTRARGVLFIKKNPRALMEKLGEIEPKISKRLLTKNFKCSSFSFLYICNMNNNKNCLKALRSNSEDFWKRHCMAVPALIKSEDLELPDSESLTAKASTFKVVNFLSFPWSSILTLPW